MSDKHLENISNQLKTVTKLLAFNLITDKSISEKINVLTKAGLKASDIADLVDRSENQVYVTQTKLRKKSTKNVQNKAEDDENV